MPKAKRPHEHWKDEPEEHDFPAAADYLRLIFPEHMSAAIVDDLRNAAPTRSKAKDVLRAAGLELLPSDDPEVRKDMKKVARGELLSPVLLVRGVPLVVADGYHRICASYHLGEDVHISCRLVDAP